CFSCCMCKHCNHETDNRKLENVAMPMTRRSVLTTAAAASVVSSSASAADTLVVTGYGGEYRDIFMETVIKPFEKKFSCQVTYDDTGGVDPYPKVRATKGSPGIDVIGETTVPIIILGAKEKYFEPI